MEREPVRGVAGDHGVAEDEVLVQRIVEHPARVGEMAGVGVRDGEGRGDVGLRGASGLEEERVEDQREGARVVAADGGGGGAEQQGEDAAPARHFISTLAAEQAAMTMKRRAHCRTASRRRRARDAVTRQRAI